MLDYLIIGAGPAGLACGLEAEKRGKTYLILEKGCVVNSIYNFPVSMVFFSTPDLLEIGDSLFISDSFRPNREEALNYYMAVVRRNGMNVATYREVMGIDKKDSSFTVKAQSPSGKAETFESRNVILATGYYDNPNMLGIEGEDLGKVSHYYTEPHLYCGKEVAVIGGKNSAVEAALSFQRGGAAVTVIYRGPQLSDSVKYWIRPDIEKQLEKGTIKAMFNSTVTSVTWDDITVTSNGTEQVIKNDFLFALSGYHPDTSLLERCGITYNPESLAPTHDPETLETNVKGLYLAGSVAGGKNCNKIFIENSRDHGKLIIS